MKKNLFMVAAVALMVLTACNKEEVAGGNQDVQPVAPTAVVEFTASFSETKTALNAEGKKTLWVETDRIDINGQEFKIKELVDGGLAAKFENVNELPSNFAAPFTAKYPYGVEEVPATQTAYAGTFDPAAVLEIATSDDHNLSFTNVTSLLKFQVPAACKTVTIFSDDVLAGSNAKTVTVNGSFEAGKTYYAAVLPGTKANFVVRIDGYLSKNATSVTIDESTIANMKTLPAPEKASWAIVGSNAALGSWNYNNSEYFFFREEGNRLVAKNVPFSASDKFKVVDGNNNWYALSSVAYNSWKQVTTSGSDMSLNANNYDIYLNDATKNLYITAAGSVAPEVVPVVVNKVYLCPSADWHKDNAHFMAWVWKGSGNGKVYNFQKHQNVDGLYEITVPAGSDKMILFRVAPDKKFDDGSTTWPGDDQWFKSDNLSITGNLYTVINWHENGSGFSNVTSLL